MGGNGQILRVSVIGTGYLGLTHAVCMADLGHQVLAIDVDTEKIAKAARGETPFFEPGLEPPRSASSVTCTSSASARPSPRTARGTRT